ncbi:MAG: hypothetical protein JNK37_14790 [Verrucomicrobiales bacterium]|nr:hypothetical protein [Verrucomicrobiales bacterium]
MSKSDSSHDQRVKMHELSSRTNFRVCDVFRDSQKSVPLITFEDHRCTLIALYHAMKSGVLSPESPPDLIRFDLHDDGKSPKSGVERLKPFIGCSPTLREFQDFVEWELSPMDDDWVKVALELGLVRNVVTFGSEKCDSFPKGRTPYKDHRDGVHECWTLSHLWHLFGYQGDLSDLARRGQLATLWETLQWNGQGFLPLERALIVDIDLDCFTQKADGQTIALPSDILEARFENVDTSGDSYHRPRAFLFELMRRSSFITGFSGIRLCFRDRSSDSANHQTGTNSRLIMWTR